jgi:hypothetical protein
MVLRSIIVAFILVTTPAMADDLSPWFGSEASEATQISLIAHSTTSDERSASADIDCPIEGCPETAKPVKYAK